MTVGQKEEKMEDCFVCLFLVYFHEFVWDLKPRCTKKVSFCPGPSLNSNVFHIWKKNWKIGPILSSTTTMANQTRDVQLIKNKGELNACKMVGGTKFSPIFWWWHWNWLIRNRQFVFWCQLIRWKKKKCDNNNNTTPPNNNNNNKPNGYSGVDAAAAIYYRRNGHGKCPAGAAANELKKA